MHQSRWWLHLELAQVWRNRYSSPGTPLYIDILYGEWERYVKVYMYIYVYMQNFHFKILTLSRQKLKVYKDIGIRIFIILEIIRMSINKRLVKYNMLNSTINSWEMVTEICIYQNKSKSIVYCWQKYRQQNRTHNIIPEGGGGRTWTHVHIYKYSYQNVNNGRIFILRF